MKLGKRQKQWIEDLRSGEFKQRKRLLHSNNGEDSFCCLGLVARKVEEGTKNSTKAGSYFSYDGKTSVLSIGIRDWIGLYGTEGAYVEEDSTNVNKYRLTYLNDDCDQSFLEIADVLEAEPERYFKESK